MTEIRIREFLDEHKRLNAFIKQKEEKGQCVTWEELLEQVEGGEKRLKQHIKAYEINEAMINVAKGRCIARRAR